MRQLSLPKTASYCFHLQLCANCRYSLPLRQLSRSDFAQHSFASKSTSCRLKGGATAYRVYHRDPQRGESSVPDERGAALLLSKARQVSPSFFASWQVFSSDLGMDSAILIRRRAVCGKYFFRKRQLSPSICTLAYSLLRSRLTWVISGCVFIQAAAVSF